MKKYKIIITLMIIVLLCGCTSSLNYSQTASEGPWEASLNTRDKDAFATFYTWDGTDEGLRIEPGEIAGCTITRYGGFYGRGLPEPFYITIPDAEYVSKNAIPDDAEITDLEFTLVINAQITDIFCRNLAGYYQAQDENGNDKYYQIIVNVELDPNNKNFRLEDGKLYKQGEDSPVSGMILDE